MKVVLLTHPDHVQESYNHCRSLGYITFVHEDADPEKTLGLNKFLYIHTEDEFKEKMHLLETDATVRDEVTRW